MAMAWAGSWWVRPAALVYAFTIGLIIGLITMVAGTLYAIADILTRAFGGDGFRDSPVYEPIRSTLMWWFGLLTLVVTGDGVFEPAPPVGTW